MQDVGIIPRSVSRHHTWLTDALVALVLFTTDLLVLVGSFVAAVGLPRIAAFKDLTPSLAWWVRTSTTSHLLLYIISIAFVLLALSSQGFYTKRRPFWEDLSVYVKWVLMGAVFELGLLLLLSESELDLWMESLTWFYAVTFGFVMRALVRKALSAARWWHRSAVIVGTGDSAVATYRALSQDLSLGVRVEAFVQANGGDMSSLRGTGVPVVGLLECLTRSDFKSTQVILALDNLEGHEALFRKLSAATPNLLVVPPLRGFPVQGIDVMPLLGGDVLVMGIRNNLARWRAQVVKRTVDIVLSIVMLVLVFFPIYLLVKLQITRENKGPVLFGHRRLGRNGRSITVFKFRTMALNAEDQLGTWERERPDLWKAFSEGGFKLQDDPRILRSARWLRSTSLDELPQLLNVLKGEMSLVGPRPITLAEVTAYGAEFELYKQVRPGVTGLWQVSGRSTTSFAERARLDAWYVRNWSLRYDVAILIRTTWVVLSRAGAY